MEEQNRLHREIARRLMDPERLQVLCGYHDEYGDDMLDKLMAKLPPAQDTAQRFGFDQDMVTWLLVLRDLAKQQCLAEARRGEEADCTADRIADNPAKSMEQAALKIARDILAGLEGAEVELVTSGAGRVAVGMDSSAEEKIACITQEVFDHADRIAEQGVRTLYRFHFLAHEYQDKVMAAGKLVDFEPHDFTKTTIKLREKIEK